MTQRERLIELLDKCIEAEFPWDNNNGTADFLLENGVIVPPCKVGDTVWVVSRYYTGTWEIFECNVDEITIYETNIFVALMSKKGNFNFGENITSIGKTVFLTREEAEKALAERMKNDG